MSDTTALAEQVRLLAMTLTPDTFEARIQELKRGGLPSGSVPGGSRSADRPLPGLDRFDNALGHREAEYKRGLQKATEGLREAVAAQNAVLMVMGQLIEGDEKEQKAAMRLAREKAAVELLGAEEGQHDKFICETCNEWHKRTEQQRPRAGRCRACYDYWISRGRPEGDTGIPPLVLEGVIARRTERRMAREANG